MIYDIAIIGAGPAGIILAKSLSSSFSICIIERTRKKCCGGILNNDSVLEIESLGLSLPQGVLCSIQLTKLRLINRNCLRQCTTEINYKNINREKFDKWLFDSINGKDNIEIFRDTLYLKHKSDYEYYTLQIYRNGKYETIKTKNIVGADGAFSRVRMNIAPKYVMNRNYLCVQGIFENEQQLDEYVFYYDKNVNDFYSWIIPKDGKTIIGGAFNSSRDARKQFEVLCKQVNQIGYQVNQVRDINSDFLVNTMKNEILLGEKGIGLVGEAAGIISPTTGEGISYAIRSARILSDCINKSYTKWESQYNKKMKAIISEIRKKELKRMITRNSLYTRITYQELVSAPRPPDVRRGES
jgi:Dehydrogenases (flavoproteins)